MSRFSKSTSYDHKLRYIGGGWYMSSWTVDRYYANSRIRHPNVFRKYMDECGAKRFAKKWNILITSNK